MKHTLPCTLLGCALLLAACKKEDAIVGPPPPPQAAVQTMRDVPADTGNTGYFTYISLRDSSIVALADSSTTKWDVAIRSTTIRTNSGTSGPGQGGAIVLRNADFDTLSQAPASGYGIDTSASKPAIRTGSGNGWYLYNPTTNIITPIPGVVLIIKTADGKYAKVQIQSYYRGAPATPSATDRPRFYTIRYFYQPDGSRKLM